MDPLAHSKPWLIVTPNECARTSIDNRHGRGTYPEIAHPRRTKVTVNRQHAVVLDAQRAPLPEPLILLGTN